MSQQTTTTLPSAYAMTQIQVGTLLGIIAQLGQPQHTWGGVVPTDDVPLGGSRDGGVRAAMDATAIKACDVLDQLISDPGRWDLSRVTRIEDAIVSLYAAQQKMVESQLNPRPCVLLRPHLFYSSGLWWAVYGEAVENRLVGTGSTPEAALQNFDLQFGKTTPHEITISNETKE